MRDPPTWEPWAQGCPALRPRARTTPLSTRSWPQSGQEADRESLAGFPSPAPAFGLGLVPDTRKHSTPHLNQLEILPNRLNLGGLYSSSLMDSGSIFFTWRKARSGPL